MPYRTHVAPVHRLTSGEGHYWFGYYEKTPWDATGRYVLGMRAAFMRRAPTGRDAALLGLIDTEDANRWLDVCQSRCWNWQQGSMLQWLPTAPERQIIYNARQGNRPVGVVMDAFTGHEKVLPRPIYAVSPRGECAMSLNFARLADTRPGYGYYDWSDPRATENSPPDDGIWHMDLPTGRCKLAVSLADMAGHCPDSTMRDGRHWVNHIQFNPDGSRIGFLHRWRMPAAKRWRTRLFACNPDGSGLRLLASDGVVSHYDWRDTKHILAWALQEGVGRRYFLFPDGEGEPTAVGPKLLECDGHCSYSPDRRWILTDTYPDADDNRTLILYRPESDLRVDVGRFYSPPQLTGEIRCDLHPRWDRDGRCVCIDSAHQGARHMYVVDVSEVVA